MKLYEKEVLIPPKKGNEGLLSYFREAVPNYISSNEIPIRFVVTKTDIRGYHCELGILTDTDYKLPSIFDFRKRNYENNEVFNVVLVIPTGIDAIIGGHAGDAGATSILLAHSCDTLIIHPNVVNASDINEMTENTLYVEGSVLSRLMMGVVALQRTKLNRLEVILDEHEDESFMHAAINSVNAAVATLGLQPNEVLRLDSEFKMRSKYTSSGRATGEILGLENVFSALESRRGRYDAVALSSRIALDPKIREKYYREAIVNPWGGVEAMLTHAISSIFNVPSAHSPMESSQEIQNTDFGIVDPRIAAEMVSTTYLHCILKGLHKSPKIVTDLTSLNSPGLVNVSDISCLVIPDKCLGLPLLAALEQGIPVIAVRGNENLMQNNIGNLPWEKDQLYFVDNYSEAVGVLSCIKGGINPFSVRRPIASVPISIMKNE